MGLEHAEQLMEHYKLGYFYKIACHYAPNEDVAQEVLSRSWLKLIDRDFTLGHHKQTKGLMNSIIRYQTMTAQRVHKRRSRPAGGSSLSTVPASPRVNTAGLREIVEVVLNGLPTRQRALLFKKAEGVSYEELAKQNGRYADAYAKEVQVLRKELRRKHSM